jgi:imidazolonepropionase-like amidohydrolase
VPAGAQVIDLSAYTVLPGLIDAHVHLIIGGPLRDNAMAALQAGFTTLVDHGARGDRPLRLRDSINSGGVTGPRILAAGLWVGRKNGVCEFSGIGIDSSAVAFRERVRQNVKSGADVAKLCVSGWPADAYSNPRAHEVDSEILREAVTEAHGAHRLAVAHAISAGSVEAAIRAGVDGLAHTPILDDSTVEHLRARGAFVVSTLASLAPDTSAASRALLRTMEQLHRRGVRVVFGTDGGVLPHGRNAEEFPALARAGLAPMDALRAATINAAQAFRLGDSVGTVGIGKSADIIAVDGDPLADPSAYGRVRFVMVRGKVVRSP